MHILSIDRNKSPLQISGSRVLTSQTLEIFQGTHILGASPPRRRRCDSSALLFYVMTDDLRPLKKYKFAFHEILRRITKMPDERPNFTIHMVLSGFVACCCGCVFGIIAFIFAGKSNKEIIVVVIVIIIIIIIVSATDDQLHYQSRDCDQMVSQNMPRRFCLRDTGILLR